MSDNLATPTELTGDTGSMPFNLTGVTGTVGASTASPDVQDTNPDLWYRFTASEDGMMSVKLSNVTGYTISLGNFSDLRFYVYHPVTTVAADLVNYAPDMGTTALGNFIADIPVLAGRSYLVRLVRRNVSSSTAAGTLSWNLNKYPPSTPGSPPDTVYECIMIRLHWPIWSGAGT